MKEATTTRRHPLGGLEMGIAAGLLWVVPELWGLGVDGLGDVRLVWTTGVLMVAAGTLVALVVEAQERFVRRFALAGPKAALVRALGSLWVVVPVSASLFEGSFASTLPGASSAFVWLPALAYVGVAFACFQLAGSVAAHPKFAASLLLGLAAGGELANRWVKPDELLDLHAGLAITVVVATYLALRLGLGPSPKVSKSVVRGRVGVGAILIANFALVMFHGLSQPSARIKASSNGVHLASLLRIGRTVFDADRDGYAAVFGGADCDDFDSNRHPAAPEVLDNATDENCDGRLGRSSPVVRAEAPPGVEDWLATSGPRAILERARTRPIFIISVDALRADVLADTPENRQQFPNLTALLRESVRFTHAYAPAAGTDLSLGTFVTGHIDPFVATPTTMFEALAAAGRPTRAVLPSEVLRYAGKTILTRGLDGHKTMVNDGEERDVGTHSTSSRTTKRGLALWAEEDASSERSRVSWLHYFDVHEHHELELRSLRGLKTVDRYRATVAMVDAAVGELRSELESRGIWEDAIVVFFSDHGEALGEDSRLPKNHGQVLYEPLVRIPVAIRVPGVAEHDVDEPVSILDLPPTILDFAGAPVPSHFAGLRLTPLVLSELTDAPDLLWPPDRPLALTESEQRGVLLWPYKLLWRPADNLFELYDLETDPTEQDNLAETHPEIRDRLLEALEGLPTVHLDRTRKGRRARERAAKTRAPKG